jgi:hypothetical protein
VPAPQTGQSLIDTGATFTSVHEPLLVALGLQPINVIPIWNRKRPGKSECVPRAH